MGVRSHLIRAAIFLVVLLSPIGAPLIGMGITSICSVDNSIIVDGPFALSFHYCGTYRPIEQLYQHSIMLSVLPMALLGPAAGGLLTILWWVAGFASVIGFARHLVQAIAKMNDDRRIDRQL